MTRHDPLVYLPRARVQEFKKDSMIYEPNRPADHLYLVISGRVRIYYCAYDGTQTLLRITSTEQFFGEACLMTGTLSEEHAIAMETTQVMAWTPAEIEDRIQRDPMLGLALIEYCAGHNLILQERVAAMAALKTGTRVALSLIQLADSMGKATPEGTIRIRGLTHQSIADYAGTSREIVTSEMNRLRRAGHLAYSRGLLDVSKDALLQLLRQEQFKGDYTPQTLAAKQ